MIRMRGYRIELKLNDEQRKQCAKSAGIFLFVTLAVCRNINKEFHMSITVTHYERLLNLGYDLKQPSTWLNPPKSVVVTSPYNINTWSKTLLRFNYKEGGAIFHCAESPASYDAKNRVYGEWSLYGVPHRIGGYAKDNEYWVCGDKLTEEEYFVFIRLYSKDKERAIATALKASEMIQIAEMLP